MRYIFITKLKQINLYLSLDTLINTKPNQSQRYKLYSFSLKLKPVHEIESSRLHLDFNVFLLNIIFKFLDVLEVLIKDKSVLLHPTLEASFFGEDLFLEFKPAPNDLWLFLGLHYHRLLLLFNIFFSLCLLFWFQLLLSHRIQNTFLIFLNLEVQRSLKETFALLLNQIQSTVAAFNYEVARIIIFVYYYVSYSFANILVGLHQVCHIVPATQILEVDADVTILWISFQNILILSYHTPFLNLLLILFILEVVRPTKLFLEFIFLLTQ